MFISEGRLRQYGALIEEANQLTIAIEIGYKIQN
jgi:hypothetical protein